MPNLTTVAAVLAYVQKQYPSSLVAPLVASASRAVLRYLDRDLFLQTYTEKYMGSGTARLILRQNPVTAVSAVLVNGVALAPSTNAFQAGYFFDSISLWRIGCYWPQRPGIVQVTYTAGYASSQVVSDPLTIPGTPYQLALGDWASDVGVSFFGGAALTKVNAPPATGQYTVDSLGNYTFAAADTNRQVVITYNNLGIPEDIQQAVNEIVGNNIERRQRLNNRSSTIDAQTVAFNMAEWPDSAMSALRERQNLMPVQVL